MNVDRKVLRAALGALREEVDRLREENEQLAKKAAKAVKADPNRYNPAPGYLRWLLDRAGISESLAARIMLMDKRMFRHMLNGRHKVPYPVQYMLESMAENPPQKGEIDWDAVRLRFPKEKA